LKSCRQAWPQNKGPCGIFTFIFEPLDFTIGAMPDQSSSHSFIRVQPLTVAEVIHVAGRLQTLVGAQLQECVQTASELGLALYHEREVQWLWFDLHPLRPLVVRIEGKPPGRKKLQRPLSLFLKSRFVGRRLASVHADLAQGRVLVFRFHRAKEEEAEGLPEIEVRLFPHGQNVIARDGDKSVAESKPKELPQVSGSSNAGESPVRSWEEIETAWHSAQSQKNASRVSSGDADKSAMDAERSWKKAIEKKEKAIERMRAELDSKLDPALAEAGEWLKAQGSLEDIPAALSGLVDTAKSLSWNIERLFTKSKDNARKAEGTRSRIVQVEKELEELRLKGPGVHLRSQEQLGKVKQGNLLSKADARGRRHQVAPDLEAYVGKSAADNLALLRRAQSFDYWLHLRDFPGSHAILRRTRNRIVTDPEFLQVGRWVAEQSLGKRVAEMRGERLDLLIVECRFVRPIKGDRLGRVNYSNDRVLTLTL
jgi:predicted ribosome quality control (RQC) complex YloA/Tae2 family protein